MRKLLLARPNDFLVNAVRELAHDAELEPVALRSLEEIGHVTAPAGAIISTAVSSSVSEPLGRVFAAVRARHPRLPVAFATLMADAAAAELMILAELGGAFELVTVGERAIARTPGAPDQLLLLRARDLAVENRPAAVQALRRHFA